jgi:UDP-GlcNAc:undecaprenyl-phosphate GlcNAc-1-phosphate transferase
VAITGLVDDIKQLRPWPRFVVQNVIAVIATLILISNNTLGSAVGIIAIDFALTLFWLVGISNSINFFDNIDGGASGTAAITSLALFCIALQNGQVLVAAMSVVLVGSTLGFLIWNKSPARIYMGDAGSLFLGLLMASLTIQLDTKSDSGIFGLLVPILLLAIPILDTSVAVLKRLVRGISPFQGGKDHLSHRLLRIGLNRKIAVIILWTLSLFFSCAGVLLHLYYEDFGRVIVLICILVWCSLFVFFMLQEDS